MDAACRAAALEPVDEDEHAGDGGVEIAGDLLAELARAVQGTGERDVADERDAGLAWLEQRAARPVFPDLWEVRGDV